MAYRLGIDVGGTNTDAVILDDENRPVAKAKTPTTSDITKGIVGVLSKVLDESRVDSSLVHYAMLGTTHCTNAIVERKRLSKVAVMRIGAPATLAIKPLAGWPEDLKQAMGGLCYVFDGGHEYDGRRIAPLAEAAISQTAHDLAGKVDAVAICSVFSPVNPEDELRAAEIVREQMGPVPVSLSHEIASIGLLERENATVLNAAVVNLAKNVAGAFSDALKERRIEAKTYFGQNDGTLMSVDYAVRYPILTIASGPTNSIRGAAFLSGLRDALVVDVGGTTTDVGVLSNMFPRESSVAVEIGGVRTNFRMPDLISMGLGGGSIVRRGEGGVTIGPDSVGYRLEQEAIVFGGKSLTSTDIAVSLGLFSLGDPGLLGGFERQFVREAHRRMVVMVEDVIDRMKTSAGDVPVVVVGGGSILVPDNLEGASDVIRPDHFEVANAIGAAIAQVSGQIERVFSLEKLSREETLEQAKGMAIDEAVKAGADPDTVEIVEVDDVPLAYLPGNATRIRVKAAGNLKRLRGGGAPPAVRECG
jgi:N-methylhydantoinase A/oxoprolinase/acetone carboxylase beta subunit